MPPPPETLAKLPGARRSLWRALVLAYRAEPRLLVVSSVLVVGSWVPASLGALWLGNFISQLRRRTILPAHDPEFEEALGRVALT